MNLKTRKIIIFSLLAIILYLGFKYYCYTMYGRDRSYQLVDIKITGNITLNHNELKEEDYYIFKNIKVKNVFEGFELDNNSKEDFLKMVKKENSQVVQAIIIGSEEQYVDIMKNNKKYKDVFNRIAKNENINNDIDLIKYMEEHNDDEVKYFMPLIKQKQIYTINEFKNLMIPSIEYVKLIDGYYEGYMFKSTSNKSYEVAIIKNNKRYFFTFLGNYTEENVNDFMNSVVIK